MIETARLLLRPHTLDDLDALLAMRSDPQVMRFIGGPMSREDAWNRLLRDAGHWSLMGYGLFAIIEKGTGQFLGQTGLAHFQRGLGEAFDANPEAAWSLVTAAHGRGFAAEAVAAAHAWFEASHPGAQTVCIIDLDNAASLRVAGKLHYTPFGQADYKGKTVTMLARARP